MTGRPIAGLLLLVAASTILMGIITAEAVYPAEYSTHLNTISDLGASPASGVPAHQPSAKIFNGAMLLAGTSIAVAAYVLWRNGAGLVLPAVLALQGVTTVGVGLFPADHVEAHRAFAAITFASDGVAALLASSWQPSPARYASVVLGVVLLAALALAGIGTGTALYEMLGIGGVERWIAYPNVLWLATFGGWLAATPTGHEEGEALL